MAQLAAYDPIAPTRTPGLMLGRLQTYPQGILPV